MSGCSCGSKKKPKAGLFSSIAQASVKPESKPKAKVKKKPRQTFHYEYS